MKKSFTLFILVLITLGCGSKKFKIEPIYTNFNDALEFGYQYYYISGYKSLPDTLLIDKVISYTEKELSIKKTYPPKLEGQYFHKKNI